MSKMQMVINMMILVIAKLALYLDVIDQSDKIRKSDKIRYDEIK